MMPIQRYKDYLKNRWNVATFADLQAAMLPMLRDTVDSIRYTAPKGDSNRARWPENPLWALARDAFNAGMDDLRSMTDPDAIKELIKAEHDEMLEKQIAGCLLSRAALNGVSDDRLGAYALGCADQIMRGWQRTPERTRERLAQARVKYGGVME